MKTARIPTKEQGSHMTLEYFTERCKVKAFTDYDGFGHYCTATEMYPDTMVYPSDIVEGKIRKGFTHVAWFNK